MQPSGTYSVQLLMADGNAEIANGVGISTKLEKKRKYTPSEKRIFNNMLIILSAWFLIYLLLM